MPVLNQEHGEPKKKFGLVPNEIMKFISLNSKLDP